MTLKMARRLILIQWSFTFSSNKANSTFECSRDGSSFKKCDEEFTLSSSGFQSYSNLKDGKHKFEVVATSGAGVKDPSPAKFSWTVKTEEDTSSSNFKIGTIQIPNILPLMLLMGPLKSLQGITTSQWRSLDMGMFH